MEQQAHDSYLEAQVLTATPQKLRLMLIEAAISAACQAMAHWQAKHNDKALGALTHSRSLLSELLAGTKPDETELTQRVTAVYVFLFKTLTEAQLRRDPALVEETIKVLQVERETWRMVCEQMPNTPIPANRADAMPAEITSSDAIVSQANPPASSDRFDIDA